MKKVPGIRLSAPARLILYTELRKMLELLEREVKEKLIPQFPQRQDSFTDWLAITFSQIRQVLADDFPPSRIQILLERVAQYIEKRTEIDFERQMKRLVVGLPFILSKPNVLQEFFIQEHLQLIKGLSDDILQKLQEDILRGIRQGTQIKEIGKQIQNRIGIGKKRALLIARNATSQYSGSLTKHNQIGVGIKKYRWSTSNDERVRSSHKSKNGNVYSWNSQGPHPRSEINCRCDGIPVIERNP
jgi:SPP1 gp7 family putative phage head morphogenesis protein